MAGEIWLALAAACVAGAAALPVAARQIGKLRAARAYPARHTGEQPRVEHQGATEEWSPVEQVGKSEPVTARDKLTIAEAQAEYWQRQVERWRAEVASEEAAPLTRALAELHARFVDQLSRTGRQVHLEADTEQWSRADIRRIRSGAPQ